MEAHLGIDGGEYKNKSGTKFLELHTSVKSYLRIEGPFEYRSKDGEISIGLADSSQTILGARTWRCYPNSTLTVSESAEDLREAISHLGDVILTTSPERSFSTLRGHPPRFCVGDTLDIPESLSKPDSGVTIRVPLTIPALLTVAPLAYYLSATVEVGDEFTIETERGFIYRPEEESLTEGVQSVLSRCFYLDCLTRTEGLYPLDLQERHDFEMQSEMDLDFVKLYNQPQAKRLETYLQTEPAVIKTISPEWPITAVVKPNIRGIEALPYLIYELAQIRPEDPSRYDGNEARRRILNVFSQSVSKSRSTSLVFENKKELVDVPKTNSQQTIWVGDGIPLNATKFLLEGYEHDTLVADTETSSSRDDHSELGLEATVVCNEQTMAKEITDIQKLLNPQDDFPMRVSIYSQLTTTELEQIIEKGTDYLHFIGHATPDGLQCSDGLLDVATIEESNITTFFLNACQSYEQGKRLIKKGSNGGIVSITDISDKYALRTSGLIGQLLNEGFAIGTCHSIIQDTTPIGKQYTVVGTHNAQLIQPGKITPHLPHVREKQSGYEVELTAYGAGAPEYTMGGLIRYDMESVTRHHIFPSSTTTDVNWDELKEFLSLTDIPVVYEGKLLGKAEFFDAIEG